jgi:hypothetical protein
MAGTEACPTKLKPHQIKAHKGPAATGRPRCEKLKTKNSKLETKNRLYEYLFINRCIKL